MAANTAANVEVAVSGHVYFAPLGTTLPADWYSTLNASFVNVGYISEGGITEKPEADSNEIPAWNGDIVRAIQTKHKLSYSFTMLETSDDTLALYYGDKDVITGAQLVHHAMVIDWQDGAKWRRNVYPDVQITERDERKLASTEAAAFGVTVTCFPDASGNKAYMYRDEDSVS